MKVYLASPLGFAHSTLHHMDYLIGHLAEHVEVINPWDDTRFTDDLARAPHIEIREERLALYRTINRELGRANVDRIDAADGVVAVLDGVDVDSGTASEIGYAFAREKRLFGIRTDFRLTGDNEGTLVNLQVQYFIEASGGGLFSSVDELITAVARWAENDSS